MQTSYILTIAGSDVLSGGGLQADLTTFSAHRLFGFVAQTCLTASDETGFTIYPTPSDLFATQLKSLETVPFSAIKIGLLPSVRIIEQTLQFIKTKPSLPVVLDPVLVFKENNDAEVLRMRDELIRFFPHVSLITPNLREAEILSNLPIKDLSAMKKAAEILYQLGAPAVIIKGGIRLDDEVAVDIYYDGKDMMVLSEKIVPRNNNGAGCTFSSSIASNLALGMSMSDAVAAAKRYTLQTIEQSTSYGVTHYEKDNN